MEQIAIELRVKYSYFDLYYHKDTIDDWQYVWKMLCDMAYFRKGIVDKLYVASIRSDDSEYYAKKYPRNYPEITLEYMWKKFCDEHPKAEPLIVPELKAVYVPESLFACPGVKSWFEHSFPNCDVTFWGE